MVSHQEAKSLEEVALTIEPAPVTDTDEDDIELDVMSIPELEAALKSAYRKIEQLEKQVQHCKQFHGEDDCPGHFHGGPNDDVECHQ